MILDSLDHIENYKGLGRVYDALKFLAETDFSEHAIGRFELANRSLSAGFRGSTNQRVLNVAASLAADAPVWERSARWRTLDV